MTTAWFRSSAVAALVLAVACATPALEPPAAQDGTRGSARPTSTATIEVLEPSSGAVVPAGTVVVRVALEGGIILEQASLDLRPDTGHIHVALDGTTLSLLAGLEYEMNDVGPGPHLLDVEYAAADHGPFSPPVSVVVPFAAR